MGQVLISIEYNDTHERRVGPACYPEKEKLHASYGVI